MTATHPAKVMFVGPRCSLVLAGEIDIEAAPNLTSTARDALADTDAVSDVVSDVVIDASAVTFIDSSGIAALVAIRKTALAQGAVTRTRGASDNVMKVLTITGLSTLFGLPTRGQPRA